MPDFATTVEDDRILFRLADPAHELATVTLWCDLDLGETGFAPVAGGWELALPFPPVDRIEYLIEADGEHRLDEGNDRTVPGAFGEHSWLPLPGYQVPSWLSVTPVPGATVPASLADTSVGILDFAVWAPADAAVDEPLPLLAAHDGPEMASYGRLLHFVGTQIALGALPRMRVALLTPGARDERYAANPAYTEALTAHLLPELLDVCPTEEKPVLMGQSLGALAALHASWTTPGHFAGLFLQSGSYFTPDLDPQESAYPHFPAITGFVATVLAASRAAPDAPPTTLVCGTAEENLANNLLMRDQLAAVGVDVAWGSVRDGHTWTCWRDLLDPHLTTLLRRVWA